MKYMYGSIGLDARLDRARRQGSILDATEHSLRLDALDAGSTLILDVASMRLDSSMPGLWLAGAWRTSRRLYNLILVTLGLRLRRTVL